MMQSPNMMMDMEEAPGLDTDSGEQEETLSLRTLVEATNLVDKLDEDDLVKLAAQVSEGFEADLTSRDHW